MKPTPDLPHLSVVRTASLHPHELPDEQRAQPLVATLARERVLKNPPIVQPIEDRPHEFVVLDGANRVTALRMLEIPHALVQVSHPNGDSVRLRTWNHVLLGVKPTRVERLLRSLNGFEMRRSNATKAEAALTAGTSLVNFILREGEVFETVAQDLSLRTRVQALRELVDAYHGQVHFERTSAEELDSLRQLYDGVACLVIFPEFAREEVVEGAANRWHFPPGITRFVVSPRALRLNYPLDRLEGDESREEKQADLDEWVRKRLSDRRVRYYAESTFLFDE